MFCSFSKKINLITSKFIHVIVVTELIFNVSKMF